MRQAVLLLVAMLAAAPAAVAQQVESGNRSGGETDPLWQFWLSGQGQLYQNFFQATDGDEEEDVTALTGEAGASLGISGPLRAYGSVSTIVYDDSELDSSNGIRLGLRRDARPHSFDVYAEQLFDRPSFDVGDEFDRADIRTLAGEWGWRFHDDWQFSADGQLQQQEFEITGDRDNDFRSLGAAIRWRAIRAFSPEVGVRFGERDVDDPTQSYGQDEAYLQIRSSLTPALYLSLRFRNRLRDYTTGTPSSGNFGREDTRRQIALSATYSLRPDLAVDFYGSRESVDSSREGRDFDTGLLALGLTWKF